jgi:hypothetical protein
MSLSFRVAAWTRIFIKSWCSSDGSISRMTGSVSPAFPIVTTGLGV